MATVRFYLLGAPRLELDGRPVEVDTRKAIALMAFLAVTGEAQRRDTLAALLWPEYDHSHALGALRRTLSSLKSALCVDCLDINRESVAIAPEAGLWFDVHQFHQILHETRQHGHLPGQVCTECTSRLVEAIQLYRDRFMAGFTLRDSPEFDDWQTSQSEALQQEMSVALERLVGSYSSQADYESALPYAQRWLALDNLHEPAHRQLMQLYAWTGHRNAALHQYQECVRILDQELGVPPLEETTELYLAIKENRLPKPHRLPSGRNSFMDMRNPAFAADHQVTGASAGATAVLQGQYPLVGRETEWKALESAYQAVSPNGHFCVLEGEAGIGKTRLAEEFLAHLQQNGSFVLTTRCYEGETGLAYGPFLEGLRATLDLEETQPVWQALPARWLSEASRLLPELASLRKDLPAPSPLEGIGAQNRFFEGLSQVLLAICRPQPERPAGGILMDDLQWADEASLDLLTYLVRRLPGRPLFLVVTWRNEDIPAGHRLQRLLAEAQRRGTGSAIPLPRLAEATVRSFVQAIAPAGPIPFEELSRRLFQETEGLPYFLVEYLNLVLKGEFTGNAQEWSLPCSVRDLLHSRVAQVSDTAWQLLQTAAVIGRASDFDTLRAASGRSEDEAISALETLVGRGLLREYQPASSEVSWKTLSGPLYDFGHNKLRALVYEETSLARRRLLHRRVAESLASHASGRQELQAMSGIIAYHYKQAGNAAEAAKAYAQAGEAARELFANAEALAHFQNALALGHPERAWLNESVGDLHLLRGEYPASQARFETAAALYASRPVDLSRIEQKLGDLFQRLGDWERAERHYKSALEASPDQAEAWDKSRLYSAWSRTALHRGEPVRALDLAQRALELAEKSGQSAALAQAHNSLGIIYRHQAVLERAEHHLGEGLVYARQMLDPEARIAALNNLALVYADQRQLEKAIETAQAALAACILHGDRHREAALHNNLADLYHTAGQSDQAMDHLKKAVVIFAEIGVQEGETNPGIWKLMEW